MLNYIFQSLSKRIGTKTIVIIILCQFMISCTEDETDVDDDGNWIQTTYYEGQPRSGSVVFLIDNKAYVGLGYNGNDYFKDFYAFDEQNGLWDDIAVFPGVAREKAVAFALNGKGYVGLGYNRDLDFEELNDFWEYNPLNNTWTQVANFPGTPRYNAVSFTLNEIGYVGTGFDGDFYRSDFYSYNPANNTWDEVASFPGGKRDEAVAAVSDGKAYFMSGRNNGSFDADVWEFNPQTQRWQDITPDDDAEYYDEFLNAVRRYRAVTFTFGNRIFIGSGVDNTGSSSTDFFEFNPQTGIWKDKTNFEGSARSNAVAFTINGRSFVGLGQNGSSRWDDFWEFFPDAEFDDED